MTRFVIPKGGQARCGYRRRETAEEGRVDPQKSRFRLRYPNGTLDYARYESLEDLAQVKHRAATTLAFGLSLDTVAWADPAVDALDVVPMGHDEVYL